MSSTVRPAPARRPVRRSARDTHRPPPSAPDPRRLARLLVRVWLEVRAGVRPLAQLEPLVTPVVYRRLAGQLLPSRTSKPVARVVAVRGCSPAAGVCEAAVTVTDGVRTTAVAVRLERHLGRWRAVELTAPEAGLGPLTTRPLPPGWRSRDAFDEVLEPDEVPTVPRPRPRGTS
ncbi:Rv3235 family protein [Egicoccus sp. AB-alg6-2]|uniref:Rv3235 family protein n=1 Tax=Egicoccus sp. AB-alg6-2 TaxID=3242692 RepID=UPI00359D86C7